MNISIVFYLISVLHNIDIAFSILITIMIIIGGVLTFVFLLKYSDMDCGDRYMKNFLSFKEFLARHIKTYFMILVPVIFINCLIPSSLTMYSMIGMHYLSDSKIPQKVVNLVNLKIDEYIEQQITPKKDKNN